jgi:cell division septation protein DedD
MSRMTRAGEEDPVDHDEPRSIFATLWFRALLVVLVLGAVAAVAVPYVLDIVNPPAAGPTLASLSKPPADAASTARGSEPALPQPPPPAASSPPAEPPASAPAGAASKPGPLGPSVESAALDKPTEPTPSVAERAAAPASTDKSTTPTSESPSKSKVEPPVAEPRPAERAGAWWVQVGAFRDAAAARRLAARLRELSYPVEESVMRTPTATVAAAATGDTSSDRYDVFVSGLAPADIQSRLTAKGLAGDPVAGGAVVKPSLPLREAVALSRELAAEGLKVQVRRQSGAGAATATPAGGDQALHRVRVGAFPDRAAALAVARELQLRGYKPFLTRGGP